ncbi:type II toxin-antitoxin system HigB family toxin [Phenylobacterium sp.]|uniref:type II toxin-antitoxin system HigB family toxin n=1 Tax=Phenylobacterium sp. TaxID=1871053 RepID=UPI00271DC31A|nr:type II toxin-antitoxin system HigB family toxin [Phenylobacterium sp.]MDO8380343.1 type II toxin-antitoxin system HigB family toxin [Phenylobacterium sp.]
MRIVAQSSLQDFWEAHPDAEAPLRLWLAVARKADWKSMGDVQARWSKAKVLNGERVRFEVAGGDYRMICAVQFKAQIVWVKFIGTHAQYDRIDALTVDMF